MDFNQVIQTRRTVRRFKPDLIPDDVLTSILEAGRYAAAGFHSKMWHFGVVTDEVLKRELATAAGEQVWITEAPVVLALCVRFGPDVKDIPADNLALKVNHLRFSKGLIDYINAYPDRRAVQILMRNGDVFIPGQQMFLAAANHGLRGCWIGYLDIGAVGRLLGLPDDMACLFLLPIGYPNEEPETVERRSLDEMTFHNRM